MQIVWNQMKGALTYTFLAALPKLDRFEGSFHLTGNDFMMEDNF